MRTMMELNDYDSDDDLDTRADFTDDILEEMKHDCIIKKIDLFKDLMAREPEFYGINKICSGSIYEIMNNGKTLKQNSLSEYQKDLFDDLYTCIYGIPGSLQLYNNVSKELVHSISV